MAMVLVRRLLNLATYKLSMIAPNFVPYLALRKLG